MLLSVSRPHVMEIQFTCSFCFQEWVDFVMSLNILDLFFYLLVGVFTLIMAFPRQIHFLFVFESSCFLEI